MTNMLFQDFDTDNIQPGSTLSDPVASLDTNARLVLEPQALIRDPEELLT